jgi:hypothetical protein
MSATTAATRLAWLMAGIAWALRSLLELARPNYYDPVSLLDWAAVMSYSAAWLLSALAVLMLCRDVGTRPVRAIGLVFAAAAVVAGLANLAEDALGQSWGGMPYIVGFLVAWLSLVPLAIGIWLSGARRIALLPVALFGSIALFNAGGGLLILVVAAAFTIVTRWFTSPATVTT